MCKSMHKRAQGGMRNWLPNPVMSQVALYVIIVCLGGSGPSFPLCFFFSSWHCFLVRSVLQYAEWVHTDTVSLKRKVCPMFQSYASIVAHLEEEQRDISQRVRRRLILKSVGGKFRKCLSPLKWVTRSAGHFLNIDSLESWTALDSLFKDMLWLLERVWYFALSAVFYLY